MLLDPAFLGSVPRFVVPVLLAALGGALCERAGVFNIALEGFVLVGAFAAVAGSWWAQSAGVGVLFACLGGMGMGLLFAEFSVRRGGDAIVVSVALNLLAIGLTTFLLRALFGVSGAFRDPRITGLGTVDLPLLDAVPLVGPPLAALLSGQSPLLWVALALTLLLSLAAAGCGGGPPPRRRGVYTRSCRARCGVCLGATACLTNQTGRTARACARPWAPTCARAASSAWRRPWRRSCADGSSGGTA